MLSLDEIRRHVPQIAAKVLLLFSLTLGLQFFAGAYSSEFTLDPDEASHYITGLMVRDYVAAGFPSSPMDFAENYYLHYPRVAFGHYPPMFYIVQAAWTMVLGVSRTSIMLLMAVLTTMLALMADAVISKEHGAAVGVLVACLILLTPETQRAAAAVMAESLLAVVAFAALIYFARYLRTGLWRHAAGFALFATLAILTKGLALALAAVPIVAALALRRWDLFRRRAFWMPAVVVAAACAPLYQLLPATGIRAFSKSQGFYFAPWTVGSLVPYEIRHLGIAATMLIGIGLFLWLREVIAGKPHTMQTVAGAALAGFLVLRMFVYAASDPRHAMILAAPLAIFLASGAAWVARRLRELLLVPFATTGLVVLCAMAVFLLTAFQVPHKPHYGFDLVASRLLQTKASAEPVFLAASWGWEEGAFISEVAMREQRPKHYVLRGYKVLVRRSWPAYETRFHSPEEMREYLDSVPVGVVVLSVPSGERMQPFQVLLDDTLQSMPGVWAKQPSEDGIIIYQRLVPIKVSQPKIQIDMRSRIGRVLEN
jgi:4-amino-4-deoxy-L-arabinose transferase-like glycosyltransferase